MVRKSNLDFNLIDMMPYIMQMQQIYSKCAYPEHPSNF